LLTGLAGLLRLLARFLLPATLLLARLLLTTLLLAWLWIRILIHTFLSNIVSNARSISIAHAHEGTECTAPLFVPPHAFNFEAKLLELDVFLLTTTKKKEPTNRGAG